VVHFILLMDIWVQNVAGADGDEEIRNGDARALGVYCQEIFLRGVKAITNKG